MPAPTTVYDGFTSCAGGMHNGISGARLGPSQSQLFIEAKRQKFVPLIGIAGKSGTGKTLSALKLARGMVGAKGKIKVIDSENLRSTQFIDEPSEPLIGKFDVWDLQPPFSPDAYLAAFAEACKSGDVVLIDSLSHEWNGEGGCLDMLEKILDDKAGADWQKRDKLKMMAWGKVTPKHAILVNALMRSPIPVICCFRVKDKVVIERKAEDGDRAKTKIDIEENAPIQRKDLIHEMLMAFEMEEREDGGGYFRIRKRSVQSLYQAVLSVGDRMNEKHGEVIAKWCAAPGGPQATTAPTTESSEVKKLKRQLWDMTTEKHQGNPTALEQYLWDEALLDPDLRLADLHADELKRILTKIQDKHPEVIP